MNPSPKETVLLNCLEEKSERGFDDTGKAKEVSTMNLI